MAVTCARSLSNTEMQHFSQRIINDDLKSVIIFLRKKIFDTQREAGNSAIDRIYVTKKLQHNTITETFIRDMSTSEQHMTTSIIKKTLNSHSLKKNSFQVTNSLNASI